MDAIILAAGENVRLQVAGLAPGRKPLLMHEGEVLIRRLARQARENPCERLIIIAAPRNVEDIIFATREYDPMYLVQPAAESPQAAFRLGLELSRAETVTLLMGDNYIPRWRTVYETNTRPMIEVVYSEDEALHPLTSEGFFTTPAALDRGPAPRWLGPLTVPRDYLDDDTPWASWVDVFDNIAFSFTTGAGVLDMGVLP